LLIFYDLIDYPSYSNTTTARYINTASTSAEKKFLVAVNLFFFLFLIRPFYHNELAQATLIAFQNLILDRDISFMLVTQPTYYEHRY